MTKTVFVSDKIEAKDGIHKWAVPYIFYHHKWYEDMMYTNDVEGLIVRMKADGYKVA